MTKIKLTETQNDFVSKVENDAFNPNKHIFILKGYAGTGKTVTSSYVAKSDNFQNILIAAPTVMAKNVLRKKLIQNVDGSKISYSTVSKLLAIPTEIIEVMNNTYQLDKSGMDKLRQMMTKLKMDHSDVIIEREFINTDGSGERFKDTKYIINEPRLREEFVKRFKGNGEKFVGSVEPSFNFKADDLIIDELCQYDLLMVDELSMVGDESITVLVNAWNKLNEYYVNNNDFYLAEKARKRGQKVGRIPTIVFAGDSGQLPPVDEAVNKYFSLSDEELEQEGLVGGVTTLSEILRSTDDIAKMASLIRKKLDPKIVAETSPDGEVFYGDVDDYIKSHGDVLREIDMALAYTRKDVAKLNKAIRTVKGFTGKSAKEGERLTVMANSPVDQYGEPFFTNGEELIITKVFDKETAKSFFNDEIYDDIRTGPFAIKDTDLDLIKTGLDLNLIDYVEVEDSAGFKKTVFISTDIEKPIEGEFKILFEIINDIAKLVNGVNPMIKVDFGYARTIHKAQGSEWNDVFGWITSKNIWGLKQRDPKNWQSLLYTMYTRGKTKVRFVYANT